MNIKLKKCMKIILISIITIVIIGGVAYKTRAYEYIWNILPENTKKYLESFSKSTVESIKVLEGTITEEKVLTNNNGDMKYTPEDNTFDREWRGKINYRFYEKIKSVHDTINYTLDDPISFDYVEKVLKQDKYETLCQQPLTAVDQGKDFRTANIWRYLRKSVVALDRDLLQKSNENFRLVRPEVYDSNNKLQQMWYDTMIRLWAALEGKDEIKYKCKVDKQFLCGDTKSEFTDIKKAYQGVVAFSKDGVWIEAGKWYALARPTETGIEILREVKLSLDEWNNIDNNEDKIKNEYIFQNHFQVWKFAPNANKDLNVMFNHEQWLESYGFKNNVSKLTRINNRDSFEKNDKGRYLSKDSESLVFRLNLEIAKDYEGKPMDEDVK